MSFRSRQKARNGVNWPQCNACEAPIHALRLSGAANPIELTVMSPRADMPDLALMEPSKPELALMEPSEPGRASAHVF